MNHLIRFKLKMLIVFTFCVFMTFSMLIYVMKLTEKCEDSADDMCFQVSKVPLFKTTYVLYDLRYNRTEASAPVLKPSQYVGRNLTSEKDSLRRTTREASVKFEGIDVRNSSRALPQAVSPDASSSSTSESIKVVKESEEEGKSFPPTSQSMIESPQEKSPMNSVDFRRKFHVIGSNSSIDVYINRQKNLRRLCPKNYSWSQVLRVKKLKLNHILIDEKHKTLYCYVPKVACTNWKRIFMVLTGKATNMSEVINLPSSKVHAKNLFKSLQNYTASEVQNITEEYTKFIFVRHPFERLLSAYRNKLEQHYDSSKYFQARFGKYIIKNFRKNPTNVSLERGDDVTFAEFVDYITSSDPNAYNEHWQRVTDLCHPCLVKYDFVGKYESLLEDSNFLLRYLGLNIGFPVLSKPSTTASNLKKYYDTLSQSAIYKLYKIYEMDFRLFSYDLFNATDWYNGS